MLLALAVGARAYEVPIAELLGRSRTKSLAETRQKLMTFSHIVSRDNRITWASIGHVFRRNHSTVMLAVRKYGDAIRAALAA